MSPRLATSACLIYAAAGALVWPKDEHEPSSVASSRPALQQPQQHLSSGSPCGPTPEEEQENGVEMAEDWQAAERLENGNLRNLTFFLYDDGVFDFSDMVDCYLEGIGEREKLDLVVYPNDAEHSTDFRLIGMLAHHQSRTWEPSEAAFHVIGSPLNTAMLAAMMEGSPCGTLSEFWRRRDALTGAIRGLSAFQQSPEKFVFIDSDWRVRRAFGDELIDMMQGKAILASADHTISQTWAHTARTVTIPYRANFMLDEAAYKFTQDEALSVPTLQKIEDVEAMVQRRRVERPVTFHVDLGFSRNTSIVFHGNMHRSGGSQRDVLRTITNGISNTSVKDVDFTDFPIDTMAKMSMATAATMLHSVFCLVPAGDTPSSRRLFDALAAGCVPIHFGDFQQMALNLPFTNTIRWGDIAIFGGGLNCAAQNIEGVKAWLESLLAETPDMILQIERMRILGRLVFAKYLSYRSQGMVGAFLGEFDESGDLLLR